MFKEVKTKIMDKPVITLTVITVIVAWTLSAWTTWSCNYPPLHDLSMHAAPVYVAAEQLKGSGLFPFYYFTSALVPNLGDYVIMTPLMLLLSPMVAVKVFLNLSIWLFWIGPATYLYLSCNRNSSAIVASLLLLPLALGSYFQWGFVCWYSGIGLSFLVLGYQEWLISLSRQSKGQLLILTLLIMLLYIWHLTAFLVYGVVVSSKMIAILCTSTHRQDTFRERFLRILPLSLTVVPSCLLLVAYKIMFKNLSADTTVLSFVKTTFMEKLINVFGLFRSYDIRIDLVVVLLLLLTVIVIFKPDFQRVSFPLSKIMPLLSLIIVYIAIPGHGGERFLPAMLVCAISFIGEWPHRRIALGGAILLLCLIVRHNEVATFWKESDIRLTRYAKAFELIPQGSRVLPVVAMDYWGPKFPERSFYAWSIIERKIFYPDIFMAPGIHILHTSINCPRIQIKDFDPSPIDLRSKGLLDCYDLIWLQIGNGRTVRIPEEFSCIYTDEQLSLWARRTMPLRP